VGDEPGVLEPLFQVVRDFDVPIAQCCPTHVNRIPHLMDHAIEYARRGGPIDLTTFVPGPHGMPRAVKASRAVRQALDDGVPIERITMSTDGNGVHSFFAPDGSIERIELWEIGTLYEEVRDLVRDEKLPLQQAILPVTLNVARLLRLDDRKGRRRCRSRAARRRAPDHGDVRARPAYARGWPARRQGLVRRQKPCEASARLNP
jgi:beta-aspartyl-dipeptidase (metallo-type)